MRVRYFKLFPSSPAASLSLPIFRICSLATKNVEHPIRVAVIPQQTRFQKWQKATMSSNGHTLEFFPFISRTRTGSQLILLTIARFLVLEQRKQFIFSLREINQSTRQSASQDEKLFFGYGTRDSQKTFSAYTSSTRYVFYRHVFCTVILSPFLQDMRV